MEQINHITIVGMGALGVLYGDFFAEKLGIQAVTFLADEERKKRYVREGVFCNGKERHFQIETPSEQREKAELLLFAVKATALKAAVRLAAPCVGSKTVILSVLNGISSEEYIESELAQGTVLGCVAQGMDAVKLENHLTYAHMGKLCLGISKEEPEKLLQLEAVCELFERSGLPYVVEDDIRHRLWSKWMLNVGVNQVVMVEQGTYGTVQKPGPARERVQGAMREVIAIAGAAGVNVTESDLAEYMDLLDTLAPDGMPSMRQDGLARRPSEVELFSGAVIKKGEQYGVDVPVNRELYREIRRLEAEYD